MSPPPTTTCLHPDFLKGYLFCLHHQKLDAIEAHSRLREFTRTEIFDLQQVTDFFEKEFKTGIYELRSNDELVIAERGEALKNSMYELMSMELRVVNRFKVMKMLQKLNLDRYFKFENAINSYSRRKSEGVLVRLVFLIYTTNLKILHILNQKSLKMIGK